MRYLDFGTTGMQVSAICMGGGAICVEDADQESMRLLDVYLACGGNFIDTANVYGRWLSRGENISEQVIGRWMESRKCRDRVILATKGGHPPLSDMSKPRLSRAEVSADLDDSLRSLRTDHIDFYWLHRDDENRPVGEILGYLNDFVREGKIRAFGCSNWRAPRVAEAMEYARRHGGRGFEGNQLMWSLARPNTDRFVDPTLVFMEQSMYRIHIETGLPALAYSSQAGGYFEKLATGLPISEPLANQYENPVSRERAGRAAALAKELSVSVTQIVLGYLTAQPFPVIPIVGSHRIDQLRQSMSGGDIRLSPDQVAFLDGGSPFGGAPSEAR